VQNWRTKFGTRDGIVRTVPVRWFFRTILNEAYLGTGLQYQDLGEDVKGLADCLDEVTAITDHAKTTAKTKRMSGRTQQWKIETMHEIIGDYTATLQDCERFLRDNSRFDQVATGAAQNLEWNARKGPAKKRLQERLQCHSSKLQLLLIPLEFSMITSLVKDVWKDLGERIETVHQVVHEIRGLYVEGVDPRDNSRPERKFEPLEVPPSICSKFENASRNASTDSSTSSNLALGAATDAWFVHFSKSTRMKEAGGRRVEERTVTPPQYLNLLKCCWILEKIHTCPELLSAPSESIWPAFIAEMDQNLTHECARFRPGRTDRLIFPTQESLEELSPEDYAIWVEEDVPTEHFSYRDTYSEGILSVPLDSSSASDATISIFRSDTVASQTGKAYSLVGNGKVKRQGRLYFEKLFKLEADLRTVFMSPSYAIPVPTSAALSKPELKVKIKAGSSEVAPKFHNLKDLLKVQHLLTGYRPFEHYNQFNVQAFVYCQRKDLPMEYATVQIWIPRPIESPSRTTSALPSPQGSVLSLPHSVSPPRSGVSRPPNWRTPSNSHDEVNVNPRRITSAPSSYRTVTPTLGYHASAFHSGSLSLHSTRPGSVLSAASAASAMSTRSVTTITSMSRGQRVDMEVHTPPPKPLLVLFLRSDDLRKFSLVAVEIDDMTKVQRDLWDVKKRERVLAHISRRDGKDPLIAQRWEWVNEEDVDLAKLGMDQRGSVGHDYSWRGVTRISLRFKSIEGKPRFLIKILRPCMRNRY